jgi:hypothetical protein
MVPQHPTPPKPELPDTTSATVVAGEMALVFQKNTCTLKTSERQGKLAYAAGE